MTSDAPKATIGKQLLGATIGMGIAAAIYGGVQTFSLTPFTALLVDSSNISENAHQVRVSDKNIDEESLRRIASRARQVASLQQEATMIAEVTPPSSEDSIATHTDIRRETRLQRFASDGTPVSNGAAPSAIAPGESVHGGAPLVETVAPTTAAPAVDLQTGTALPNSGFGTTALITLALLGAAAITQRKVFSRA